MLKTVVLAAVVSLAAAPAYAIHFGPAAPPPPAPPAPPPVPGAPPLPGAPPVPGAPPLGLPGKPKELYTVTTALTAYNPITEKYNATVRITSNPCPNVTYDNTLSAIARDPQDAQDQVKDQLNKIEQDIRNSAAQCPTQ